MSKLLKSIVVAFWTIITIAYLIGFFTDPDSMNGKMFFGLIVIVVVEIILLKSLFKEE